MDDHALAMRFKHAYVFHPSPANSITIKNEHPKLLAGASIRHTRANSSFFCCQILFYYGESSFRNRKENFRKHLRFRPYGSGEQRRKHDRQELYSHLLGPTEHFQLDTDNHSGSSYSAKRYENSSNSFRMLVREISSDRIRKAVSAFGCREAFSQLAVTRRERIE